ncbi:hypothetical protein CR513_36715, partial [Mucuna pruriens]
MPEQYVEDLRKLFDRLRKYKLRLNSAKYTFDVKSGKLLGFIVNERGIEVDPNKIRAIREMPALRTESESKGHKKECPAEHLAHHPISDYQPLLHEFSDEHIMIVAKTESKLSKWKMWLDRASNLLGNGIGAILALPKGQCFPFLTRLGFDCTNNMTEYEACAMGIMMALEHQVKKLKFFRDLALVIYQLRGEWETLDTKLIPYYNHVKEMSELFNKITSHHVL